MKRTLYIILAALAVSACQKESAEPGYEVVKGFSFTVSEPRNEEFTTKSRTLNSSEIMGGTDLKINLTVEPSKLENTSGTKGTPIETKDDFFRNIEHFKLWSWNNGAAITELPNTQTVKKNGQVYIPVNELGQYIAVDVSQLTWNNPVFYGLAPLEPSGTLTINSSNKSTFQFTYSLPNPDTEKNCDAQAQKDLLTGVFCGTVNDLKKNIAPMQFDHPLSSIRFIVGNVGKDVSINSISLEGIPSKGTCSINPETGAITWSSQTSNKTFTQTFAQDITTSTPSGTDINDASLTKTFFTIPYKFSSSSSAKIVINYSKDGNELVSEVLLREQVWEPGKNYIFTIDSMAFPWIDFVNIVKRGGGTINNVTYSFNEYVNFTYPQVTGDYEKFVMKIHDLSPGQWYNLDFTEWVEVEGGNYWNGGNNGYPGEYACSVLTSAPTSIARGDMITYYKGEDSDTYDKYFWMGYEGEPNGVYIEKWQEHVILTFKATSSLMYWVWDVSKCYDGSPMHLTFRNNGFTPISVPTVPCVDFLNSDHYGFWHKQKSDDSHGFSTFKTTASFGTDSQNGGMEFHAYPMNGKHEKLNIPLTNLSIGHKYRITYKYRFDLINNTSKNNFGFNVDRYKNTNSSSATSHIDDGYQDLSSQMVQGIEYSGTYDFEALDTTMYWIWDMSRLQNEKRQILFFYETTITDISE